MIEAPDLNLIAYVIKITPHKKLCELTRGELDQNDTYYHAIILEKNDIIQVNHNIIRITQDLALAEVYGTGAIAKRVSKTLTLLERTNATVHPVSTKVFFEAHLKGLR